MVQPYQHPYDGQVSQAGGIAPSLRVGWIDDMRVAATLATVVLHVASPVVVSINEPRTAAWWTGNLIESLSRWCVPLFVMISGYLLLLSRGADDDLGAFYQRRIGRVLIPLVWWTIFFLVWGGVGLFIQNGWVDWNLLIQRLIGGKPYYHLWYLYMLPSLYLFSPFLQRIVRESSRRDLIVLCVIFFIFAIGTDTATYLLRFPAPFFFCQFLYYLGYYLAGYLLGNSSLRISYRLLWMILIGAVSATSLGCFWFVVAQGDRTAIYVYSYLSPTVVPMTLAVFLMIKQAQWRRSPDGLISQIAPLTFGIYLVHPIWLDVLKIAHITGATYMPWLSIPILVLFIFLASLALSKILLSLPVVRQVIL